ncbi:MAG: glycosyl transferase, group 1 family protein [Myxococcaceae bacterium]|nr:glycosyl transferase, group 1 family protein [Myxococcaceae bacterium]
MKKLVLINGRFLSQRATGVQRYALETLRALDRLLSSGARPVSFDLELVAPPGTQDPALSCIRLRHVGTRQGHAWEQLDLLAASRGHHLLSFGPTGPLLKRDQTVTIHDAAVRAVPHTYSKAFRAWYGLAMPLLVRRAAQVMTVSEFSRGELSRYFGADPKAVRVSGEGYQHATRIVSDPSVLASHGLLPKSYVLAVSSVTPHKNFAVIARAAARLGGAGFQVVVAGDNSQAIFGDTDLSAVASVKFVGYVSDGELRALYENAALFVFPSLYEGFGLPPLEAMAFDCPVVASNAASIPEVCGEAALYFEPTDDEHLARLIERLMQSPAERAALVEKGRAQLQHHSWEASALAHLSALEQVLAARG